MVDPRIPVFAGDPSRAEAGDAVLRAVVEPGSSHIAGCACCGPRPALARALARLFMARARGETAFFDRVIVACPPAREADMAAAIAADPVSAARFRFAGRLPAPAHSGLSASPSPSARCM